MDSAAFGLLAHWLYTQGLRDREGEDVSTVLLLAKVWLLARRSAMPFLRKFAMDKFRSSLISTNDWSILVSVINYAHEFDKPEDSLLYKLVVEKFTVGKRERLLERTDKVPQSFVTDIVKVIFAFHDRQPFRFRGKIS